MKHKHIKFVIDEQVAKLYALAVDLPEMHEPGDADFQAKRVLKIAEALERLSTQIHGSGTGK